MRGTCGAGVRGIRPLSQNSFYPLRKHISSKFKSGLGPPAGRGALKGTPKGTTVRKMLKLNDRVAGRGHERVPKALSQDGSNRIFKDSGLMTFKILGTFPL